MSVTFMGGPGDGSQWDQCPEDCAIFEAEELYEGRPRYLFYWRERGDDKMWFGGYHDRPLAERYKKADGDDPIL